MYNLRYHIITIVAIFLALTIGIVMGAAIGGSEALRQTSSSLVTSLQSDYKEAVAQKDQMENELNAKRSFTQMFIEGWADGALEDRHAIVVSDKGSQTAYEEVQKLVEQAGGHATRVIINPKDYTDPANKELADELMAILGVSKPEDIQKNLSKALIKEWSNGEFGQETSTSESNGALGVISKIIPGSSSESTTAAQSEVSSSAAEPQSKIKGELSALLVSEGVINFNDLPDNPKRANYIVNIAVEGEDHKAIPWGLDLAQQALQNGMYSVSTQLSNADDNLIVDAQTRGFSAVAALDTQVGGYSVLALLVSEQTGVYGLDGTKAYPDLPKRPTTTVQVIRPQLSEETTSAQAE